jgi:outer membrane receptor protein involved in Fe transport
MSNQYTFKGTFQLPRNNQIIGFLNKREKLQDKRGLGPSTPLSAAQYQSSRNYPMKVEWTSVLGSRAFLDVTAAEWYNFFPLRPTIEAGVYSGPWGPGRTDLATNILFDGGANSSYQDQKRFKPQFYASLAFFQEGWHGSHDFKFGFDWKRDRRSLFNDQPFDIFYRDRNGAPSELELYNTPVTGINDVEYNAVYFGDTWRFNDRLTLNLGGRLEHYRDGWPEQSLQPNGHPALRTWNDPVYRAFVAPIAVAAEDVSRTLTFAPRAGFAFDLSGDHRTVLKVFYGQFHFNSADTLANQENPVGRARLRYQFRDTNGNDLLDGPHELGRLLTTVGGGGFVRIDREITRPSGNELSTNVERELLTGLSARVSYVYKNIRDDWAEYDPVRAPSYTVPITITDPGPDNIAGNADDQQFQSFDRPASAGQDRVYTNPNGNDADFHTVEFAVNRRFSNRWMLLTSFGNTWSKMLHDTTGFGRFYSFRPFRRLFGDQDGREISTFWNYKVIGRYVMPFDIGVSGSWKVQSGQNYGRTISFAFPGDGNQTVRVEPIDANRYPTVAILDLRFDKAFRFGRFGTLTGMVDLFNLTNSSAVTSFRTTTVNYREVTAILDPRIVRFGLRFEF